MTSRKSILCTAIGAVLFVGACSDSSTQPQPDLTAAQLRSISRSLQYAVGVGLSATVSAKTAPVGDARTVMSVELPFAGSAPCPEGGRVGVTGSFTTDSAGNAIIAASDTLVDCAVKDNQSNTWTFTSKPAIASTITELSNIHGDSIDQATSAILETENGTVHFSTGSLSGTCPINLSSRTEVSNGVPTADSATVSLSTAGTVCGLTVAFDTSSTIGYHPGPF